MPQRDTDRQVHVTVETADHTPNTYSQQSRGRAMRTFPADTAPGVIAGWAGRTAIAQLREAQASYPIQPDEPVPDPAERLEAIAAAPTDEAASEAAGDASDLPF